MNGIFDQCFSTIHITPESHCSYVSYEALLDPATATPEFVSALVARVLATFRPATFTYTLVTTCPWLYSSSSTSDYKVVYSSSGALGRSLCMYTDMFSHGCTRPSTPISWAPTDGQIARSTRRLLSVSQSDGFGVPPGCVSLSCSDPGTSEFPFAS
eukprot:TRINITY_DN289_c0_g2_i4.p2 TRINITY_DN289_c0_g2~~TRINITY_DN289_c0_g2_i4.p2  ORF type:complete len:167 (-),score=21.96 TRINITY_DN289_c0_g2_i4:122-589(-)